MRIIADLEVINFDHYQGLSLEGDRNSGQLILKSRDGASRPIANFDKRMHALNAFSSFCDALTIGETTWVIPTSSEMMSAPEYSWTIESFREFASENSPEYFNFYESKNVNNVFYKMAVDLINLVQERNWQLTPGCRKWYFCLYRGRRRIFGVNLMGTPRLAVWIPEKDADFWVSDTVQYEKYYHGHRHAVYPPNTTIEKIEPLLDFAYDYDEIVEGKIW